MDASVILALGKKRQVHPWRPASHAKSMSSRFSETVSQNNEVECDCMVVCAHGLRAHTRLLRGRLKVTVGVSRPEQQLHSSARVRSQHFSEDLRLCPFGIERPLPREPGPPQLQAEAL